MTTRCSPHVTVVAGTARVRLGRCEVNVHTLVAAVADLLAADQDDVDTALREIRRRQARLNETALLVADTLDQREPGGEPHETLPMRVIDAELAAERLAVASRRLAESRTPVPAGDRAALLTGLDGLLAATATGTPPDMTGALLDEAGRAVAVLTEQAIGPGDRVQRVAFATTRLASALRTGEDRDDEHGAASEPDGRAGATGADDPDGGATNGAAAPTSPPACC